jgi:hypothetical protein
MLLRKRERKTFFMAFSSIFYVTDSCHVQDGRQTIAIRHDKSRQCTTADTAPTAEFLMAQKVLFRQLFAFC